MTPALIKDRRRPAASPYRTVLFLASMSVVLLVGLLVCSNLNAHDLAEKLYTSFVFGVVGLAGFAFGHSSVEKLAAGTGVKGMVKVLMTDAVPGGEQPAQPTPAAPGGAPT